MAAVAESVRDAVERAEGRVHGADRSALEARLERWGTWMEEIGTEVQGFPSCDAVSKFLDGCGGGTAGHRILAAEQDYGVYLLHVRIRTLEHHEQWALWLNYVFKLKHLGGQWSTREKCALAGITETAMWKRLQRARLNLLGIAVAM